MRHATWTAHVSALLLVAAMALSANGASPASDAERLPAAFAAAMTEISKQTQPGLDVAYMELGPWISQLAPKTTADDIRFLKDQALVRGSDVRRRLALLLLAKGLDAKTASGALTSLALGGMRDAIDAMAYLPSAQAREAGQRIALGAKETGVAVRAIELLGIAGDKQTEAFLKRLQVDSRNTYVIAASRQALVWLRYRLGSVAPEQLDDWDRQARLYWLAPSPRLASVKLSYRCAADSFKKSKIIFDAGFLKPRVQAGEPLAMAIAASQKEASLSDDLADHAKDAGYVGTIACEALLDVDKKKALRVFESGIVSEQQATDVNKRLIRYLADQGDLKSLEVLRAARKTGERSPGLSDALDDTIQKLRSRLESDNVGQ